MYRTKRDFFIHSNILLGPRRFSHSVLTVAASGDQKSMTTTYHDGNCGDLLVRRLFSRMKLTAY